MATIHEDFECSIPGHIPPVNVSEQRRDKPAKESKDGYDKGGVGRGGRVEG